MNQQNQQYKSSWGGLTVWTLEAYSCNFILTPNVQNVNFIWPPKKSPNLHNGELLPDLEKGEAKRMVA